MNFTGTWFADWESGWLGDEGIGLSVDSGIGLAPPPAVDFVLSGRTWHGLEPIRIPRLILQPRREFGRERSELEEMIALWKMAA